MVEPGTWPSAPPDTVISGLKELPEDGTPLTHSHLFFGHCFKSQGGWREMLARFTAGGGTLLDLEFLTDDRGRRVAAFGFMAGFAGAAVGLMAWCQAQNAGTPLPQIEPYPNEGALIAHLKGQLEAARAKAGRSPRVIVMGALGRCGTGAVDLCTKAGVADADIVKWDMAETAGGGPFPALLEHDIFINCIYLSKPIPPFISEAMLDSADRRMTVLVDVSCDTTNPHNPLPFCNTATYFSEPCLRLTPKAGPPVDVVAIDHLPTLLPLESSAMFAADLLPTLRNLPSLESDPVWARALALFRAKVAEAQ